MISTRWRSPAERSPTVRWGSSGSPYSLETSVMRAASLAGFGGFSMPRATFSATESASKREKCWKTMATPAPRAARGSGGAKGAPRKVMWPSSGLTRP